MSAETRSWSTTSEVCWLREETKAASQGPSNTFCPMNHFALNEVATLAVLCKNITALMASAKITNISTRNFSRKNVEENSPMLTEHRLNGDSIKVAIVAPSLRYVGGQS